MRYDSNFANNYTRTLCHREGTLGEICSNVPICVSHLHCDIHVKIQVKLKEATENFLVNQLSFRLTYQIYESHTRILCTCIEFCIASQILHKVQVTSLVV